VVVLRQGSQERKRKSHRSDDEFDVATVPVPIGVSSGGLTSSIEQLSSRCTTTVPFELVHLHYLFLVESNLNIFINKPSYILGLT
jgi:hypothetical protein